MKTNLNEILEKRLWTISIVHKETGVSRNTLTNLYYGYAKGIQFNTLFKICNFLKVSPTELLGEHKEEETK
ncbi:helix-turn-helix domain-containing protein [Pediococcus parvulus]|uniref:helix-turn-helix domain-containing protein n=1 Tax=Pediococcus parvulus TaxID=54062 RepID=UPI0021A4BA65|nr:helix-turn-helix transcriptional regulator [Pediococcus parvulus]MCT3031221.1 XRE family transcriptional regulator [Pediococcus parvulus]